MPIENILEFGHITIEAGLYYWDPYHDQGPDRVCKKDRHHPSVLHTRACTLSVLTDTPSWSVRMTDQDDYLSILHLTMTITII
jgi:hypothetical protein